MTMRLGLVIFLLSVFGCSEKEKAITPTKKSEEKEITKLDWMLGKWIREDTGELELWSKRKDSFFGGMMVTLNEDEKAVIQEVLALEGRKDGIYFSSKPRGGSNAFKVEYKMSNENFEAPKFINSNPNDPKYISYMKIGQDKIKVEKEEMSFYYVREI